MSITMTLNADMHKVFYDELVRTFEGKSFNVLVQTCSIGDLKPKVLKYCGRTLGTVRILKPSQASIRLNPGGRIAWDLVVEYVAVVFEAPEKVVIQRFFSGRQYRKLIVVTTDPI